MNFNTSNTVNYQLYKSLTDEMINLYGVLGKFIKVEKINQDSVVFGDFTHLKSIPNESYEIYMLPENSDTWDSIAMNFGQYGMSTNESVNVFVSRASIEKIYPNFDTNKGFEGIYGNLIVMPNGRLMEITFMEYETPGINNLYLNNDVKSAYKLTLKTYANRQVNELTADDIGVEEYATLNNYFNELLGDNTEVDTEAEVALDPVTQPDKPLIDNTEDSVFGRF